MALLYLMVGVPCFGKTTRAKVLENEVHTLRFTQDEWQVRLFGHDTLDPEHDKRYSLIEIEAIFPCRTILRLLNLAICVHRALIDAMM